MLSATFSGSSADNPATFAGDVIHVGAIACGRAVKNAVNVAVMLADTVTPFRMPAGETPATAPAALRSVLAVNVVSSFNRICCTARSDAGSASFISSALTTTVPDALNGGRGDRADA